MIADEITYQKKNSLKPNYQLFRLSQQSGGTTVNLSNAGGQESIFEIPSHVFNFSRSGFSFDITAAAQATDFVALFLGGSIAAIRDMDIYLQNGTRLLNIPNCNKYLQVVRKTDTKLDDFLTQDSTGLDRTNIIGAADGNYRFSVAANGNPALANARVVHQPSEPLYTSVTDYITSEADNTDVSIRLRFNLSEIKNTIAELDKDVYFRGEIIYIRITWAPLQQVGADGDDLVLTAQGDLVQATITNLNFYLAVEKNPVIVKQIKEMVMNNGMQILIDYVHSYNQNLTGTSHALSQKFSRVHGRTLKKIYTIPYIGSSTTHSNYFNHHYDQAGEAILSLYTTLNNERLQQWNMVTENADEYMVMKDILKGSVIQTTDQFLAYYFFVDTFDNLRLHEREPNVQSGLPLDEEQKYDILVEAEAQRNYYQYAVCQRILNINANEITLN